MINNFIKSIYGHVSNGLINVSVKKKQERLSICSSCEFYNSLISQCKQCGCLLEIKTLWASEKCPIDKWTSEISSENQSASQLIPASGDCGCNKK